MQFDPYAVLGTIGVGVLREFPYATDCPICHRPSKLELRSGIQIRCMGCGFVGDAIELVSTVRNEPLLSTLTHLATMGLVEPNENVFEIYINRVEASRHVKDFFRSNTRRMAKEVPGSIHGILGLNGARFHQSVYAKLAADAVVCRRDDIEAHFGSPDKFNKDVYKWWGQRTAIVVPVWFMNDISGAYIITAQGEASISLGAGSHIGAAYTGAVSFTDEVVCVVDDALVATKYNLWAINESVRVRFVCPTGLSDAVHHFSAKRIVYWSTRQQIPWLTRSFASQHAQIFLPRLRYGTLDPRTQFPSGTSCAGFLESLIASDKAHKAIADLLLARPTAQAIFDLSNSGIGSDDRARILSTVQGDDVKQLEKVMADVKTAPAINWNQDVITEGSDGWFCNGKKISAAVLHLESQQQLDQDLLITGTVSADGSSFPFKERYSVISKNCGDWMRRFLVTRGKTPYIEMSWKHKFYEIARRFHEPRPVVEDAYGWHGDVLRFPNFCIDATKIYPTGGGILGPLIPLPAPLSPAEWDAFRSEGFCRLFLVLLQSVLRSRTGGAGTGIILSNEAHIIERLAGALYTELRHNPSPLEVEAKASEPLPTLMTWTESGLRDIFAYAGPKNLIVSTDSHTAQLSSILYDWIRLSVGNNIDYFALRALFLIMPQLIRHGKAVPGNPERPYRDLAERVQEIVGPNRERNRLIEVGLNLDLSRACSRRNIASRIVELCVYGRNKGLIEPEIGTDTVTIPHDQFIQAMASPIVRIPPISALTAHLVEARYIVAEDPKAWKLIPDSWAITNSLMVS